MLLACSDSADLLSRCTTPLPFQRPFQLMSQPMDVDGPVDTGQDVLLQIQAQLNRLSGLEGLQNQLNSCLQNVQTVLLAVQSNLAGQNSLLTEVQRSLEASRTEVAARPPVPAQLGKKHSEQLEFEAVKMDCLHEPSEDPPILSLIPGEIVSKDPLELNRVTKKSSTVKSNQSGTKKKSNSATLSKSMSRGGIKSRVMSMEDVEAHTLHAVLGGHGSHDSPASRRAISIVEPVVEDARESVSLASSKDAEAEEVLDSNDQPIPGPRTPSRNFSRVAPQEGKRVLQMCRRMSLDDLRTNHDAVIATTQRTETNTRPLVTSETYQSNSSSFSRFAILWLDLVGILDFANLRPGFALFCISIVQMIFLVGVLIFHIGMGLSDPYISATTLCYLVGVLCAAWRLRWSGVHHLLRADGLEAYAMKSGFLDEWRRTSRRRLKEVGAVSPLVDGSSWLTILSSILKNGQCMAMHGNGCVFSGGS